MSAAPGLLVAVSDRILRVTLDRPEKRNALSRPLLAALGETFRHHAADETLVAAVLTGAGDKSFAAGGDLRDLAALRTEAEARQMALDARATLDAIRRFPVPVVAALNGDALGGGAELAASCDFRVAAAHARIGFIQGRLAISTAWGGGIDLVGIVGRGPALRLLATAAILDAPAAAGLGLVDAVAAPDETLDTALERFFEPMRRQAPQVLRAFKAVTSAAATRREAEDAELGHFARCWVHPDHWAAHDQVLTRQR